MAGYVYNPAESIRQDFQQAGSAVGNIFAQVIQQQQRDYALAENAFSNIEALKKDLNIYGQKSITSKANTLLGHASSAILQNGKLDYSKMGEIRQAVSDIKDLKTGYELGAKEYERMLQIGIANKDNLLSFEGFYKDLSEKMSDENLIKNPRDLQASLADTYTKNLDATKMFGKSFLAANPYRKIAYDVKDPKTGAMMRVEGELPVGWTVDPSTGKAMPPEAKVITNPDGSQTTVDYADQTLAQLKATNPETLAAMRRQAGAAGENYTDKQLVEYYTTKVPMLARTQQISSSDELRYKKAAADEAEFKAKTAPEKFALEKRVAEAQIANYYERSGGSDMSGMLQYAQQNVYEDKLNLPTVNGQRRQMPVTGVSLGKNLKMTMNGQQALVTDVLKSKKTGDLWAAVLVQKGADNKEFLIQDETNLQGSQITYRKIKNPANFVKELSQKIALGGYAKNERPFVEASINGVLGAQSEGIKRGMKPIKVAAAESAPKTVSIGGKNYDFEKSAEILGVKGKSLKEQKDAILKEYPEANFN